MSEARIAAVKVELPTYTVARGAPFHWTTEVGSKFVPAKVKVKAAPPAVAVLGFIPEAVGVGLAIVNIWAVEVPPPGAGLKTVTLPAPGAEKSPARMAAVSVELLINEVLRLEPFH
jgi:hypothetical protein